VPLLFLGGLLLVDSWGGKTDDDERVSR